MRMEWTQASFPAVRNPVSSKCATSAAARFRAMTCSAGGKAAALRAAAGRQGGASVSDPLTLAEYVTQCPKMFVR